MIVFFFGRVAANKGPHFDREDGKVATAVAGRNRHPAPRDRLGLLYAAGGCFIGGWLVFCLLLMTAGCRPSSRELTVLVSGDTHGWITPCGCAANQAGGLARRATLVDQAQAAGSVLLLDAGGSAFGTSAYQRLKLESLLRGLSLMGLTAHNIGQSETQFGPSELLEIGNTNGIQWLAANLTDSHEQPVGATVLELTRGDISIAVTGVIAPELVENEQWRASDPVRAVLKSFAAVEADLKIVLAYMNEDGLRQLAEALPEIDYIIGGPTGQAIHPARVGRVTLMSATNKGKFLARVRLQARPAGFEQLEADIAEVSSLLDERKDQQENLNRYYARLADKDFRAVESGLVTHADAPDSGYTIAGSEACASCHQPDDAVWHASKHAHAWEVLVSKGAQFDPQCQQCHTTGYALQNGFDSVALSPTRVHVGCESCHGPSQAHVDDPRARTTYQARQQCLRCHDQENSPNFQMDRYWAKIAHSGLSTREAPQSSQEPLR